jgi:hypothetical protein
MQFVLLTFFSGTDDIFSTVVTIPVYEQGKLRIAEGIQQQEDIEFERYKAAVNQIGLTMKVGQIRLCEGESSSRNALKMFYQRQVFSAVPCNELRFDFYMKLFRLKYRKRRADVKHYCRKIITVAET